jgi:pyruvate/2-oxoglutarate dehydrogenase complex dihydrolipoamide dehydrogenase (E3) component
MRHTANLDQRIARAAGEERITRAPSTPEILRALAQETPGTSNSADEISRKRKMSQPERYEMLILGSGAGGKLLAWHMAKSGRRTAVVERKLIGGSCPNTNCLPSKNEIWSAKVADLVHHADRFGMVTGPVVTDMKRVLARKREMVDGLIAMHLDLYKTSGAELIMGAGRCIAPKTIEVSLNDGGMRVLTGDRVVLNLGTHATIPDIPGLAAVEPLTNVEALELDRLPDHLIVIGGGYVGLELAQAYRRFGSRVTIIETGPQLASREDPDVAAALLEMLRDEGIAIHLGVKILGVRGRSGQNVSLRLQSPSGDQTVDGSDILVAAGRTPNTSGIGLELAGVALDPRGYIAVNDRLETSAPEVWAVGECAGSPQFTHVSEDDFRIIRDNLAGGDRTTRNRLVPYCMFTDPPLARVGLSEAEARRQDIAVRVAKLPIVAVLRTRTTSETRGFMKALVAADGDQILGFAMLGAEAGEVMAVVQTAMLAGMPYTGLRDAILAHPTMAEGLGGLFSNVPAR